ncbi:MAG: PaaI family thioesterase [Solirubrobacterales bacterium]|nr:PaaI family thioesterase [Solirubrobacterales bacterium]
MQAGDDTGIDPLSSHLGFRWESHDRIALEIRDDHINAAGLLSGVVSYGLVDYCMGSTLWKETTEEERIATISISINHVQTAREGTVVCASELDRRNDPTRCCAARSATRAAASSPPRSAAARFSPASASAATSAAARRPASRPSRGAR